MSIAIGGELIKHEHDMVWPLFSVQFNVIISKLLPNTRMTSTTARHGTPLNRNGRLDMVSIYAALKITAAVVGKRSAKWNDFPIHLYEMIITTDTFRCS